MPTPRVTIDGLPEQTTPEPTNMLVVQDAGVTKRMAVSTMATKAELDALAARVTALETP